MTTLLLQSKSAPYIFRSLGIYNNLTETYEDSALFPINTTITLTSGRFPLTDYKDMYEHSKQTHCIGNKTVKIIGFDNSCIAGQLNKYGNGHIIVI